MESFDIDLGKLENIYSEKVASKRGSIDDYVSLILLYWDVYFDYGIQSYCVTNNIFTEKKIMEFDLEIQRLFEDSSVLFSDNSELVFWRMFIEEQKTFSPEMYRNDIIALLEKPNFLLPYFYLYVQCDIKDRVGLIELKKQLGTKENNYKKHYIFSYLESI